MPSINHTGRGRLISLEGLNGVGKTYLTTRVVAAAADHGQRPLVVEGFSRRSDSDSDLGRRLLRTLVRASHGERFLRAGFPKSETLLLLAIKMHDFETTLPARRAGRTVIEGRSIHSTAVYQSLIMNPHDDVAALALAEQILDSTAHWRPLPDLAIVITDDVEATWVIDTLDHLIDIETSLGAMLSVVDLVVTENLTINRGHGRQRFHYRRPFPEITAVFARHGLSPSAAPADTPIMYWTRDRVAHRCAP